MANKVNDINKWFYSLTLSELQEYIVKLGLENERLIKELNSSAKLNTILENVAKSTQTGYTILRRIEINKNCNCNEHLNHSLRKSLHESISETNMLLNHLQICDSFRNSENRIRESRTDIETMVDIPSERLAGSPNPIPNNDSPIRDRLYSVDKDSALSSSASALTYDLMDDRMEYIADRDEYMESHSDYGTTESHSESQSSSVTEIPQNLTKPKNYQPMPTSKPVTERGLSSPLSNSCPSSGAAIDKNKHLLNKCTECELSFNLKPSLEQHLLTHVNTTFTFQKAGRGRPAKNRSRILKVTDSELNILQMNDTFGSIPEGMLSMSTLEQLKKSNIGFGRYRCPWPDCGYTPHFLRDLRRHMFKHTGDKKYRCDVSGCDFITVWKTSLLQHQRKKHNILEPTIKPINIDDNTKQI